MAFLKKDVTKTCFCDFTLHKGKKRIYLAQTVELSDTNPFLNCGISALGAIPFLPADITSGQKGISMKVFSIKILRENRKYYRLLIPWKQP